MSIEMPTMEPESVGGQHASEKVKTPEMTYAKNEALIASATGFDDLSEKITAIGSFYSSSANRMITPIEIIANINTLKQAPSQEDVKNVLKEIPRMFGIRGKVMDIMGIE